MGDWIAAAAQDIRADIYRIGEELQQAADAAKRERQRMLRLRSVWWPADHIAPIVMDDGKGVAIPVRNAGYQAFERAKSHRNGKRKDTLQKLKRQHLDGEGWPREAWVILQENGPPMLMHADARWVPTKDAEPMIGTVDYDKSLDWRL